MRVVITGGGTGGHIIPALAVADALRADPAVEAVLYIGKTGGMESEIIPAEGIPFEGIVCSGMPREKSLWLPFKLLAWWLGLQKAVKVAEGKLRAFRPQVVLGTGGYVSAPVLMAARRLKIPYVVHEPDAHPGLVNRLMARHAALVTTSFEEGAQALSKNGCPPVRVTGNPLRGQIGQYDKARALAELQVNWPPEQRVLLVTGGSQGARSINRAVAQALPALLDNLALAVIHLTGKTLYEETLAQIPEAYRTHARYWVRPFEPGMGRLMGAADVALCRAGSLSLSEMYVCGLPTILVPYPYAAADHQRKNAQASVRGGASVILDDAQCTGEHLLDVLRPLLSSPGRLQAMADAARRMAHPDATREIVQALQAVAQRRSHLPP